jgi:hypothetical protein
MSTLIYGKVTHVYSSVPFGKNMCFEINSELVINAPAGSFLARSVKRNDFGYFVFDKNHKLTDCYKPVFSDGYMNGKISHHQKCLEASAARMVEKYNVLSANDKAIVANAVSMAVSGSLCVASVIGTVVSIFSGDFTGILGGAAASAVTGAYAYIAYDSMSKAMQNAYDCSEAFHKALSAYHTFTSQSVPEHMRGLPLYNIQFSEFTKLVRTVFPHITEQQFMTNDINWSVA